MEERDDLSWMDPKVQEARTRLRDIATTILAVEGYGSLEDVLELNRKLHEPRLRAGLIEYLENFYSAPYPENL
jgi:hypothetical protein